MAHLTQDSTFTLDAVWRALSTLIRRRALAAIRFCAANRRRAGLPVDEQGEVAHQWQLPVRAGRDAVLLPNGNLGYNGSHRTSANLYPAWILARRRLLRSDAG